MRWDGSSVQSAGQESPTDSVWIITDEDGDGLAETRKEFATGFNSVQGLAWKGDWLWVANAPELTRVRDTNGDDLADEYIRVYTDLGNLEHALHGPGTLDPTEDCTCRRATPKA